MDPSALSRLDRCPAPAKINLFLHVTGRRPDGYHLLQTGFRLLDWADELSFVRRDDGRIRRTSTLAGVPAEQDLVVRAAHLLKERTGTPFGADITVDKHLPMGGGLGGGSSNAATTLIALNRLWRTGLDRETLADLGLTLGADVPFFVFGRDAFAEGIGERLQPMELQPAWYVVVWPAVEVPTARVFAAEDLTRNSEPIRIANFAPHTTRNDLQAVACRLYPEVAAAVEWLEQHAPARMTGSGACVFAQVEEEHVARRVAAACPAPWRAWAARSLLQHPLLDWLD